MALGPSSFLTVVPPPPAAGREASTDFVVAKSDFAGALLVGVLSGIATALVVMVIKGHR